MASYNVDLALVITTECISVQRPVCTAILRNSFVARIAFEISADFSLAIFHFRVTSESFHLGGGKRRKDEIGEKWLVK